MPQENRFPPAIFLMGPTASGKTALALALVERFPCEIVSVDSVMVYRGMDIGSAKPSPAELRSAPHRLIDIRDPADSYSAAQFRDDALREMASITAQGRIPLLVGGTMLYFRALEQGLSDLPAADPGVRARIEAQAVERGWPALHERLLRVDPIAGRRIHPNDPQRIQRALEVFELTGRRLSELCARDRAQSLPYRRVKLAVVPRDRALLHRRIEQRFGRMLDEGLIDEVERLYRRGDLRAELPAIRAVGYRQVWEYLAGSAVYRDMTARAITATRQLAKRQLTWLRKETGLVSFDSESSDIRDQVFGSVASIMQGCRALGPS